MPNLSAPLHPVLDTIGLDANHYALEQVSKVPKGGGGLEITSKRGAHYTWEGTGLLRPIQKPTLVPDHESIN